MDVAKASRNREIGADLRQGLVNVVNVLGLGVERIVVNLLVVDTVFFAPGNSDFLRNNEWRYGWD